ncbi:ankyrin repeat-containing domain protein [Aspergillus granulosus]|uniref:Ankyrin repeat-containing domain protein n=1 Tax=Aspergillus granulosus TaxID=176169 RepID=A0ABR4GUF4_9EURO
MADNYVHENDPEYVYNGRNVERDRSSDDEEYSDQDDDTKHDNFSSRDQYDDDYFNYFNTPDEELAHFAALEKAGKKPDIFHAAKTGDVAIMREFIDGGWMKYYPTLKPDADGNCPLMWAAVKGHEPIVRLYAENMPDKCINGASGHYPLVMACMWGHTAVVKTLIEFGQDVNACEDDSALHFAAQFGYVDIVKALVEAGADIGAMNSLDDTAMDLAVIEGRTEVVVYLLEMMEKFGMEVYPSKLLYSAVGLEKEDLVRALMGRVEKEDREDALFKAISLGNEKMVRFLLEDLGVDVNAQTPDGQDPLFWAAQLKNEALVKLLLDQGAAVDRPVFEQPSILAWAVVFGNMPIVQMILDKGADPNILDEKGRALLQSMSAGAKGC